LSSHDGVSDITKSLASSLALIHSFSRFSHSCDRTLKGFKDNADFLTQFHFGEVVSQQFVHKPIATANSLR
jgi:hypothetical protein